ncbi:MAG: hypothetical protein NDJ89_04770 [Oligoflexia bacterium]|nr:hypothetical protein [Oligoflexia bacterium]
MKKHLAFGLVMFGMMSGSAFATADLGDAFSAAYPNSELSGCKICHEKKPKLNVYGIEFQNAAQDFKAIEALDSDGDGVSNLDEINNGTFPGDKNSV